MHSGRLRRDLQVHCRAGQCPTPEAPGVLPVLRRSVHLGRIRLLRRGPGGVTPITDTLSPRVLLRCSGCGLRWTAATLDPAACPACGRRERIALVRRFGPGRMSLHPGPSPALVESLPGPEPRRPTTSGRSRMSPMSPLRCPGVTPSPLPPVRPPDPSTMDPLDPADYERIKPPKKGKPYPYKCRICGAPAAWTETFAARDRRHRLVSWRICEQCYRDAGGTM